MQRDVSRRLVGPAGVGRVERTAPPTSTPPTPWCGKPSLTCSKARSTRNVPKVCTIGRIPVSARPAPTFTSSCSRMPTLTTRSGWLPDRLAEEPGRDLGEDQHGREVLLEQVGGRCARTACADRGSGRRCSCRQLLVGRARSPRRRGGRRRRDRTGPSPAACGSRPSTVVTCQPSVAKRAAIRPGTAYDDERLSTTTTVRASRPSAAASSSASWLEPSSSSASPTSTTTRELSPWARRPSAVPTRQRQAVSEGAARDLHAGHQVAVGVVAERGVERRPGRQPRLREEPAVAEHGVVGHRAVALRQQEAVAARVVDELGRDVEHALVQHPEHGQGRVRREVVLLVAGQQAQQSFDVVHAVHCTS